MDFILRRYAIRGQSHDAVRIGPQRKANLDNRAHDYCPAAFPRLRFANISM